MKRIAALFVETNGAYFGLPEVDPWDAPRDARLYPGPYPVVAHPPCERWGRYWSGGPMLARTPNARHLGNDGGCFASALMAVRNFSGVLEHPEASHAWKAFGLMAPPREGGWVVADDFGGWTCCVEQGHYGHNARKATWLYACGVRLPELKWGSSGKRMRMDQGCHSKAERARLTKTGICQRLSKRQRAATPIEFRDLLLAIARAAGQQMKGSVEATQEARLLFPEFCE
jgi:hypothetical protein